MSDLGEEGFAAAEGVENADDGSAVVGALMNHVELHREPAKRQSRFVAFGEFGDEGIRSPHAPASVDGVLRRRVPVQLLQSVLPPVDAQTSGVALEPELIDSRPAARLKIQDQNCIFLFVALPKLHFLTRRNCGFIESLTMMSWPRFLSTAAAGR